MLLQKRSNGVYYFRWVVPPALRPVLNRREIYKSLRTTSKHLALARAGDLYLMVEQLKGNGDGGVDPRFEWPPLRDVVPAGRSPDYFEDDNEIEEYARAVYETYAPLLFGEWKDRIDKYQPETVSEAEEQFEANQWMLKQFRKASINRKREIRSGLPMRRVLRGWISQDPRLYKFNQLAFVLEVHPPTCAQFLDDVFQLFFYKYEIITGKLDPAKAKAILPSIMTKKPAMVPHAEPQNGLPRLNDEDQVTFAKLIEEFFEHKKPKLTAKVQAEYLSVFPIFVHFMGDKPITGIKKRDVKDCLLKCLCLPKRNLKAYRGKEIAELAGLDVPESDRISHKTVDHYRKLLQGIFHYAVVDKEYLSESPAKDIDLGLKVKKTKAAFTQGEVTTLLRASLIEGEEWQKWVFLLAAYTGARRGEIAQLRKQDIKIDADSGLHYVLITDEAGDLKTDNAFRIIPLHSKLIELGFLDYVNKLEGELFSGVTPKKITDRFGRFRDKLNIPKVDDLGRSRTFHCLRHSFTTRARAQGATVAQIHQLVGHGGEDTGAGITDRYTDYFTVAELKPVVELVQYL